ncbi:MAG: choice-of-anchor V domain-containing protein [Bacteroidota bacterium]
MKIKHLPWISSLFAILLFSGYTMMYPNGAPAAVTGSPGDGSNCTSCHGGTATTTASLITSNIPAGGYTAGQTYQITATNTLTGSGKYGFEVSPQNASGTQLGTLVAGSGSKLVGGTKYVTHSNATSSLSTWTFNWVAPAAGTGAVTFYGAFAKGKPGPVTLSQLTVQEAASAPGAAGAITGPAAICLNNSATYSITSISGATGYVWTAPSGATIASGQGTTSVSVSFVTGSTSGNISVYGTNTVGNGTASNKMITVNSVPSPASSVAGSTTPCQASSQTYSVTNVSGVTYTWVVPAGSVISSGQGTSSINVTVGSGNGNITVTPSNSCGSAAASSTAIAVSPVPLTPATPDGPAQVNIQNTMACDYTTTGTADSYVWQLSPAGAGTISGTTLTGHVAWNTSFIGNAQITVKAQNSCGESAFSPAKTVQVLNTTGVDENAASIRVITGQPEGSISLVMNTSVNQARVQLLDLSGRVLLNTTIPGQGTQQISQNLKPGIYILVVDAGDSSLRKKILVI